MISQGRVGSGATCWRCPIQVYHFQLIKERCEPTPRRLNWILKEEEPCCNFNNEATYLGPLLTYLLCSRRPYAVDAQALSQFLLRKSPGWGLGPATHRRRRRVVLRLAYPCATLFTAHDWCRPRIGLDWIEQCFTSLPTQYRLYGRRFLQVKRPNQHYQSTEGTYSTQTNQTYNNQTINTKHSKSPNLH